MQAYVMIEPKVHYANLSMSSAEAAREEFTARIKRAVEHAGWQERGSQKKLAAIVGVTPKAAGKWFNCDAIPNHEKIIVIADSLGVRAEWLEYGVGSMTIDAAFATSESHDQYTVEPPSEFGSARIKLMDQAFSAGHGAAAEQIEDFVAGIESVPTAKLAQLGIDQGNARIIKIRGDSMYPTIWDGDELFADTSRRMLISGEIFAFAFDDRLLVKRFTKRIDGSWLISGDNKDDPSLQDEVVSNHNAQSLRVIGQVKGLHSRKF